MSILLHNQQTLRKQALEPIPLLQKHGLEYDQKTVDECIKEEDHNRIAEWDEDGNPV